MSLNGMFLLMGLLLASAGGFAVISSWEQEPKGKKLSAYILIGFGIALFALGVLR